jgi:hypothetical protein
MPEVPVRDPADRDQTAGNENADRTQPHRDRQTEAVRKPPSDAVKAKVRAFRDKADMLNLKAAQTKEVAARLMFEDAAQQWSELADNLEKRGRSF